VTAPVDIRCGDCRVVLAEVGENTFDACVTDPPYGLEFTGIELDEKYIAIAKARIDKALYDAAMS